MKPSTQPSPKAYCASLLSATRFTPGRVRLRIPSRRKDEEYFHRLENACASLKHVIEIKVNPATASILFVHDLDALEFLAQVKKIEQFELVSKGSLSAEELKSPLPRLSAPEVKALQFTAFTGLAILQTLRGFPLGPGSTLMKQAVGYWDEFQAIPGKDSIV